MDALKKFASIFADKEKAAAVEATDTTAISIEEIAMREEKVCGCICEYDAS
ncbi:hypothetical protein G4G28_01730 [Massilia sp. Dwa41.01b]|uniref:hypothetical protein n=1 Tax=unclassified Massilia TaxID=2609279 RepID=UPI001603AAE2|nr:MULTISPECIES: hypothetical protein [unclassified Massilia]QNA87499.1 hypothetical protein G4G28_01730 [Massilia sp. Dwa41.01b]QNA98406.1 hypothetical protein G4G31_05490 [Massilia sp. Se16.2.3]